MERNYEYQNELYKLRLRELERDRNPNLSFKSCNDNGGEQVDANPADMALGDEWRRVGAGAGCLQREEEKVGQISGGAEGRPPGWRIAEKDGRAGRFAGDSCGPVPKATSGDREGIQGHMGIGHVLGGDGLEAKYWMNNLERGDDSKYLEPGKEVRRDLDLGNEEIWNTVLEEHPDAGDGGRYSGWAMRSNEIHRDAGGQPETDAHEDRGCAKLSRIPCAGCDVRSFPAEDGRKESHLQVAERQHPCGSKNVQKTEGDDAFRGSTGDVRFAGKSGKLWQEGAAVHDSNEPNLCEKGEGRDGKLFAEDRSAIEDALSEESAFSTKTVSTTQTLKNMLRRTETLKGKFDVLENELLSIKNANYGQKEVQNMQKLGYYYADVNDISNDPDFL